MLHECFFCNNSFGHDAIDTGCLHVLGKRLICCNCLAELRDALGLEVVKEAAEDPKVEADTKDIFAV